MIVTSLRVAALLLLAGCGPETGRQKSEPAPQPTEQVILLTDATFEERVLHSHDLVLVDFWAAWCQPCMKMKPAIREMAEEYSGRVKIGQLNVKDNPFTAAKYEIKAIPALLLFRDGKLIRRIDGPQTKGELAHLLDLATAPADRSTGEK